jgi:nitrate reductase NapE component
MDDKNTEEPGRSVHDEARESDEALAQSQAHFDRDERMRRVRQEEFERKLDRTVESLTKDLKNAKDKTINNLQIARSLAMVLAIASCTFILARYKNPDIFTFFLDDRVAQTVAVVGGIGVLVAMFLQLWAPHKEKGFVGIDIRAQEEVIEQSVNERVSEFVKSLAESGVQGAVSYKESDGGKKVDVLIGSKSDQSNFETYVISLIKQLDFQISTFDKKASEQMDTGVKFLMRGIYFYILSIFLWQYLLKTGYVGEYAFIGMVSCTLTFLVVEFLAAWFLRQYKGFVESSMNLVRVKALFNRYMLSYYTVKEFSEASEGLAVVRSQLLKVLEEAVKWPDPTPVKAGDLNHMVAMFESVTGVIEKMKDAGEKLGPKTPKPEGGE